MPKTLLCISLMFSLVQIIKRANKAKMSVLKTELFFSRAKLLSKEKHIFPPKAAEEKAWPWSQANAPKRKTKIIPNKIDFFIFSTFPNINEKEESCNIFFILGIQQKLLLKNGWAATRAHPCVPLLVWRPLPVLFEQLSFCRRLESFGDRSDRFV